MKKISYIILQILNVNYFLRLAYKLFILIILLTTICGFAYAPDLPPPSYFPHGDRSIAERNNKYSLDKGGLLNPEMRKQFDNFFMNSSYRYFQIYPSFVMFDIPMSD